jgi:uncharacterized protein (TIGR02246 family)
MKKLTKTFALIILVVATSPLSIFAQKSNKDIGIGNVIMAYGKALNDKNIDDILQLFSEDGVLVLQGAQTSIGTENIKKIYTLLFESIDFGLIFRIEEVVQMSPEWAFVRTTTSGQNLIRSNNKVNQANGHEIFILKKGSEEDWKIARYAGSSAK